MLTKEQFKKMARAGWRYRKQHPKSNSPPPSKPKPPSATEPPSKAPLRGESKQKMLTEEQFKKIWRAGREYRKQHPKKFSEPRDEPATEKVYTPLTPLTVERANQIVEHAEREFRSGKRITDAFEPFAQGGAANRHEALCALYLAIAGFYRVAVKKGEEARFAFEQYAEYSRHISVRILTDGSLDADGTKDLGIGQIIDYESVLNYIKTLNPREADFWPLVYGRIGLYYPAVYQRASAASLATSTYRESQPKKRLFRWTGMKRVKHLPVLLVLVLSFLTIGFLVVIGSTESVALIPIVLIVAVFVLLDVKNL